MNIDPRYISLTVSKRLDKSEVANWYACVRDHGPEGIVLLTQNPDDQRNTSAVIEKRVGGKFAYIVYLERDMTPEEAEAVVEYFTAYYSDLDFDIELSNSAGRMDDETADDIQIDPEKYVELCQAWAKRQHQQWFKERTRNGWNYGPTVSMRNKTHPLLRPWEDLPPKFKTIDTEDPQRLVDMLNDQGYMVVRKEEVESIFKLLRLAGY